MIDMTSVYYSSVLGGALLIALIVLFCLARKVNHLVKKHDEERIYDRMKLLEGELEEYMVRSQRRLDIFKRVIDGFDHIIQGVKGIMAEEEQDEIRRSVRMHGAESLVEQEKKEAEIIHLDRTLDTEGS